MNDAIIRNDLVSLLKSGQAHITPDRVLSGIDLSLLNSRPSPGLHSIWEELEHMRVAQEDILRYMTDPAWKSPNFPEGYWPETESQFTERKWTQAVERFFSDLNETIDLVNNATIDLTNPIPHGVDGHTYLREILLIADHNAYHLGQIVQLRKLLADWNLK